MTREMIFRREGLNRNEETQINISDMWDLLIREAATCKKYASDIIYDIQAVTHAVNKGRKKEFWLGFRENGVDGRAFIESRLESGEKYNSVYYISISSTEKNSYGESWVTVEFGTLK